jgi:hypothetical protein
MKKRYTSLLRHWEINSAYVRSISWSGRLDKLQANPRQQSFGSISVPIFQDYFLN